MIINKKIDLLDNSYGCVLAFLKFLYAGEVTFGHDLIDEVNHLAKK